MNRVLLFEPDDALRQKHHDLLEKIPLWVFTASTFDEAFELLKKNHFHLSIWSVEGLADLPKLQDVKRLRPATAVMVTSSSVDVNLVVQCIRLGASNFYAHSPEASDFVENVKETLHRVVPETTTEFEPGQTRFPDFVGRHPKILEIFQLISSIRNSDSTVLITGESGTGKEVVARTIHNISSRAKMPWVAVNCGAIPGPLLESELFGHVRGAFTGATQNRIGRFQYAGEGTLFLDEISDLSFDLQAKILRAIQNRVYEPVGSPHSNNLNARIIAATNQDLNKAVAEKRFRQDLFYRLNVIPIYMPPLRARKSDVPLLARNFLEKFSKVNGKEFVGISEEAMALLVQYHWPGNIRELENLMERVVVLKQNPGIIELKDLPSQHFSDISLDRFVANVSLPDDGIDLNDALAEFENELILQALQKTSGNKNRAAGLLNLNRTTLVEKLKRKGLRIAA